MDSKDHQQRDFYAGTTQWAELKDVLKLPADKFIVSPVARLLHNVFVSYSLSSTRSTGRIYSRIEDNPIKEFVQKFGSTEDAAVLTVLNSKTKKLRFALWISRRVSLNFDAALEWIRQKQYRISDHTTGQAMSTDAARMFCLSNSNNANNNSVNPNTTETDAKSISTAPATTDTTTHAAAERTTTTAPTTTTTHGAAATATTSTANAAGNATTHNAAHAQHASPAAASIQSNNDIMQGLASPRASEVLRMLRLHKVSSYGAFKNGLFKDAGGDMIHCDDLTDICASDLERAPFELSGLHSRRIVRAIRQYAATQKEGAKVLMSTITDAKATHMDAKAPTSPTLSRARPSQSSNMTWEDILAQQEVQERIREIAAAHERKAPERKESAIARGIDILTQLGAPQHSPADSTRSIQDFSITRFKRRTTCDEDLATDLAPVREIKDALKNSQGKIRLKSHITRYPHCRWEVTDTWEDELGFLTTLITELTCQASKTEVQEFQLQQLSYLLITLQRSDRIRPHFRFYSFISRRAVEVGLRIPEHEMCIPEPHILEMSARYMQDYREYLRLCREKEEKEREKLIVKQVSWADTTKSGPSNKQHGSSGAWKPLPSLPSRPAQSAHSKYVHPKDHVLKCFAGYHEHQHALGKNTFARCPTCFLRHGSKVRCLYATVPGHRPDNYRKLWRHAHHMKWISQSDVDEWNSRYSKFEEGKYVCDATGKFPEHQSAKTPESF